MDNIPKINDLSELAFKLGLPKFILTRYIFQNNSYYKKFKLTKRSGRGHRKISAPSRELKGIQKWITSLILSNLTLSTAAKGYRKGISIKDNARPHVKMDFVCNIDLENFFPSISIKRVYAIFKSLGYSNQVAWAFSRLVTFQDVLPQGAPSSPIISNIVMRHFDKRIIALCRNKQWNYTRYCDDLTISGMGNFSTNSLKTIIAIIESEGFKANSRKTRIRRRNSKQTVTGLVVNDFPNLTRDKRKNIRAIFHQAHFTPTSFAARKHELLGLLSYFKCHRAFDTKTIDKYRSIIHSIPDSVEKIDLTQRK